jgi:D-ribose pyranose/furanose isomerase RbsD
VNDKLIVLAEISLNSENEYYNRIVVYERVPNFQDHILESGKINFNTWRADNQMTFALEDCKNLDNIILTTEQNQYRNDLKKINYHLDNETEMLIMESVKNSDNKYTTYEPYYSPKPMRRSWIKSYFNGFLNTEKTLIDLIQEIKNKITDIFNSSLPIKSKLQEIILVLDNEEFKDLLKIYYNDVLVEISIIVSNIKKNYQLYNDSRKNQQTFNSIIRILMKILFKRSNIKELHEKGKNGDWYAALEYVKLKINNNLIQKELVKKHQSKNPILVPVLSVPKLFDIKDIDSFLANPNNLLQVNLIPLAYAFTIQSITKWETDIQINENPILKINHHLNSRRESKSVWERFGKPSYFQGKVFSKRHYIVIDDNITLGSSVRDLQEFIEINGGYVLSILSLDRSAKSLYDNRLKPKKEVVERKSQEYKHYNNYFKDILGYESGIECLTKQEINALRQTSNFKYECLKIFNNNYFVKQNYFEILKQHYVCEKAG